MSESSNTVTVGTSFRGSGRFFARGQEVAADDPVVARYPSMFERAKVRTTATVPGEVTDPDEPVVLGRPSVNASKATWRWYVASLNGADNDSLTKAELVKLADELEG